MNNSRFFLLALFLLIVQILVWAALNLTPFVVLAILPAIVLMIPIKYSGVFSLLFTFALAFAADFCSHGVVGMCSASLLPVALLRKWIIRIVFGSELAARGEDINIHRLGYPKVALGIFIANAIFLMIYVWIDGAGTRTFAFNALRLLISCIISTGAGLLAATVIGSDYRRWR